MKLSCAIIPGLVAAVSAGSYEPFVAPDVQKSADAMVAKYSKFTAYKGPAAHIASATQTFKPVAPSTTAAASCDFWMEDITHQGVAAFNPTSGYKVYRNVMDYGAKGDGTTDDTAAINAAISDGQRNDISTNGQTSTNQPAVVYFPAGTYVISSPVIPFYYTQLIGNPNCMPSIKASPNFSGFGLIDSDPYNGQFLSVGATNVFYKQIRNLVIDMTAIPGANPATGIHWPASQATSLQNLVFEMSADPGTQHVGVFTEQGSGGMIMDLVFNGGMIGLNQGGQQFTNRNLTFNGVETAINQIYAWGWTFQGLNINNCTVGLNASAGANVNNLGNSNIVVIDSSFTDTPTAILTSHSSSSQPIGAGGLAVENTVFNNCNTAIADAEGDPKVAGSSGTTTVAAYVQGNQYTPSATAGTNSEGTASPFPRPSSLLSGSNFYTQSKPQYGNVPSSSFVSARDEGAKGDGTTDDTSALQSAITKAASSNSVLFVDAGTYLVTKTISVPPGSQIVGESYSVIMSSGDFFNDESNPVPVVQVGTSGQSGAVAWSDMIVSTQGAQAGAILIEWNLNAPATAPSGMWDVHTRIGGFVGSNLQVSDCPAVNSTTIDSSNYVKDCVAAFMSMHVTPGASGLYMENCWLWTADHDIDSSASDPQVTIYSGRGLLIESTAGNIWQIGTAVEHHQMYQYQYYNTQNVMAGQIQTETPYWQPNPNATVPFATNSGLNDPVFPTGTYQNAAGTNVPNAEAYGLRVVDSSILFYGVGTYSFFNEYSTSCSDQDNDDCQSRIISLESTTSDPPKVYIYDVHTVATDTMLSLVINGDRTDMAVYTDNLAGFTDDFIAFRPS